ncbi:MAG: hypothetical protein GVY33_08820, partial [Alphaproteobacteria bacterium]|nr:hypothetical protein [Alphaproteobacteria bacterium]
MSSPAFEIERAGFLDRLETPRNALLLVLVMWVPLTVYVLFGDTLDAMADWVLLPAVPAAVLLYVMAVRTFAESWIALVGATLVFFWLIVAVAVPFLPLVDPNQPIAPFTPPLTEARDHFFVLGA